MSSLTQTESAYYFATTNTNLVSPGVHSKATEPHNKPSEDNKGARRCSHKVKEIKKGKRKEPEYAEKSGDGNSVEGEPGREVQREEKAKNDEEEPCLVCNREYGDGDKMILCDGPCKKWYHIECAKVSTDEFDRYSKDKKGVWKCNYCIKGLVPPVHNRTAAAKNPTEASKKKRKINYK